MDRSSLILTLVMLSVIWRISGQRRHKQCPRLQKPWNGNFIGTCGRHVGSQCVFQCRDPYILVGSTVRTCRSDGTWSGSTAACELDGCDNCGGGHSNCANLYNPANGYTHGQCTPGIIGQVCKFYCENGYSLVGHADLKCLKGGHWSSNAPECRRRSAAMCEDVVVENAYVECTQQGGLTVCRITCEEEFMIVGSSVVTCSPSGQWSDQIPNCRRSVTEVGNICPTLTPPDGGRLVGSCTAANTGDTCQLVCLSGYRPTDTRVLICQTNGRWSNSLPRCIGGTTDSGCPIVSVSQGSISESCTRSRTGQTCTITCNAGYTLTGGSGSLVCLSNGQWSDSIPSCIALTCPVLAAPAFGGSSGTCSPGQVGQTCTFYCNSGYRLVGQSTLICGNDGRWSGNPPYCTGASCPNLNPPVNGETSGSCSQATVGQACSFSCQAGYTLNGQSTLYCQAGGVWSSSAPTCTRVTCPNLNNPENGFTSGFCSQASVGQSCTFMCQSGYTLSGQSTLYCQNGGQWSSSTPVCIRQQPTSCASLVAPTDGFMIGTCAPGQAGQTCMFGCDDGFALRGQRTLTCQSNGQWSHNTPQCESTDSGSNGDGSCPVLTPPPHGEFLECDNRAGGQCIVVCEKGYTRSGSRVRTCLSQGTWSGYAPTCTRTVGYTTYTYKVVPLWSLVFG